MSETPVSPDAAAAGLAAATAALREATANLAAYVDERAAELAQPRITAAKQAAAVRVAEVEARLAAQTVRADALAGEVARLAWVARYLPAPLRELVIDVAGDTEHPCPQPAERFVEQAAAAAGQCGVVAYAVSTEVAASTMELTAAVAAAVDAVAAVADPTRAYHAATELGRLVSTFTAAVSTTRAEQAARVAEVEHLSVGQLAERLGMSKARAHQMLLAARRPAVMEPTAGP